MGAVQKGGSSPGLKPLAQLLSPLALVATLVVAGRWLSGLGALLSPFLPPPPPRPWPCVLCSSCPPGSRVRPGRWAGGCVVAGVGSDCEYYIMCVLVFQTLLSPIWLKV